MTRVRDWIRTHPNTIAYMMVATVFVFSVIGINWEASNRRESDQVAAAERRAQICQGVRDQQQVVRDLVVVVTQDSDVQGVDLTLLPSFNGLAPETKAYLLDLQAALNAPSPGQTLEDRLREFSLRHLSQDPCPAETG